MTRITEEMDMSEIVKLIGREANALSEMEEEVAFKIADYIDEHKVPRDIFGKSLDEINEWFGGHDNVMVTEQVRLFLEDYTKMSDIFDEMADDLGSMVETDDEY